VQGGVGLDVDGDKCFRAERGVVDAGVEGGLDEGKAEGTASDGE
jgi:hypothetical protein